MSLAVAATSPAALADRPIRVMVVDDAVVARSLLRRWIDAEPDMEVVAALRTGRQAVDAIEHRDADVVMLDVDVPVGAAAFAEEKARSRRDHGVDAYAPQR